MRWTSRPVLSRASRASHSLPQMTLMQFQPAPRKAASSSWMILPLPRTGPSRRCRLQLMTKIRLSRPLAAGQGDGAERFRLVALAVAEEAPDLLVGGLLESAIFEIAIVAGLVDAHDRAEAHRDGGKLPEIRHQPGMRIARQAAAGGKFAAEVRAAAVQ